MEEKTQRPLISNATFYVNKLFKEELPSDYVYHTYNHTIETLEICHDMAEHYNLPEEEAEILLLAACFHDTGYIKCYKGHETESIKIARNFLEGHGYDKEKIKKVEELIISSSHDEEPKNLLEEILTDADFISMGKKGFFSKGELLRIEWEQVLDKKHSDLDWEKLQLQFLLNHDFYTRYALKEYGGRRNKNIRKQRERIRKTKGQTIKKKTGKNFGRGIDTLYRTTYRNHINLSSIADGKANMMISINTIILSVVVTLAGTGFSFSGKFILEHVRYIVPIFILIFGCLFSVIFAIISARPNVTKQDTGEEEIKERKSSILFFGNFVNVKLKNFVDNLRLLKKDQNLLYDNMAIDMYYLGHVLKKKYKLLRISYTIFMLGLVLSVVAFTVIFLYTQNSNVI